MLPGWRRTFAFPSRGRCHGCAVTDEVESLILTPQRQNTSQNTSSAACGGSFPSRGSLGASLPFSGLEGSFGPEIYYE